MSITTNAKGKPFSWSFSALHDYDTCPFQYAHKRFYCSVPFIETEAIIWGNRVHKAAELDLKHKPHNDPVAFDQVEKYTTAMLRSGLKIVAEQELALNRNLVPTGWFSKDCWLRIKIDVTAETRDKKTLSMFDWKSGKNISDNEDQLKLTGAVLSVFHPGARVFRGKYIWTKQDRKSVV